MKTELISLVGKDEAGEKILDCLGKNKVSTRKISISDEISTAMNIVRNNRESRTGAGKI